MAGAVEGRVLVSVPRIGSTPTDSPSMFQPHQGYEPNEEFLQTVPLEYHPVLTGSRCFQLEKLTRELKAPAEKYPFAQEA